MQSIKGIKKIVSFTIIAIFTVYSLAPLGWLVITSVSTIAELQSVPPHWIPENIVTWRYNAILLGQRRPTKVGGVEAWGGEMAPQAALYFRQTLLNSLIVAVSTTAFCVIIGSLAAYAYARLNFRGKSQFLYFSLSTSMIPAIATLLPITWLIYSLNLIDTYYGLILVYVGRTLPFVTWLMVGFFRSLPREMEDAAMIDGCSRLGAYLRIVLPLSTPGLVAMGIFSFISSWNEFLFALLLTNTYSSKTVPISISEYSMAEYTSFPMMSAAGLIAIILPVTLALLFQRYVIKGLTAGAIKG